MTRDDIIRIMREVCFEEAEDVWNDGIWAVTDEELERFVARVESAEREACAKLCDDYDDEDFANKADMCAEAIRARGDR